MNILLIQKEGIDLHHTLFSSETSRLALRFYHPKKRPCGVYISCSTLGSALSLVRELRWYMRRYVREPLFELEKGVFFTHELAQDIYYERTTVLGPDWKWKKIYRFKEGKLIGSLPMAPGTAIGEYSKERADPGDTIEIWCKEDEVEEGELVAETDDAGYP